MAMKEVKKLLVVLVAAVFFIGLFVLCDKYSENVKADYASQINPSIVNQGSSGTGSKGQTVMPASCLWRKWFRIW